MKALEAICQLVGCDQRELEAEIRKIALRTWNRERKRVQRRMRELHDELEEPDELDEEGL